MKTKKLNKKAFTALKKKELKNIKGGVVKFKAGSELAGSVQ